MGWSQERIDVLKKLWVEGKSCNQIARHLGGITKNAVIGKVHRLGLQGRVSDRRHARSTKAMSILVASQQRAAKLEKMWAANKAKGSIFSGQYAGREQEREMARQQKAIATIDIPAPGSRRVALLDLEPGDCRWPIGDPKEPGFSFCGATKEPVGSYCEFHARKAYVTAGNYYSRYVPEKAKERAA